MAARAKILLQDIQNSLSKKFFRAFFAIKNFPPIDGLSEPLLANLFLLEAKLGRQRLSNNTKNYI